MAAMALDNLTVEYKVLCCTTRLAERGPYYLQLGIDIYSVVDTFVP